MTLRAIAVAIVVSTSAAAQTPGTCTWRETDTPAGDCGSSCTGGGQDLRCHYQGWRCSDGALAVHCGTPVDMYHCAGCGAVACPWTQNFCVGLPQADSCNEQDDNKDGCINGGCPFVGANGCSCVKQCSTFDCCGSPTASCTPPAREACYSGPAGTDGKGICQGGDRCPGSSTCDGEVTPIAEICGDYLDNDCDGTVDNTCPMEEPQNPKPRNCDYFGDPVSLSGLNSEAEYTDVTLFSSLGHFPFRRTYVSRDDIWAFRNAVAGLPRPFGSSPTNGASLQWSHNLFSFVRVDGPRLDVRDQRGTLTSFWDCASQLPCWASNPDSSRSVRERLQRTADGFKFYRDDSTVLVFEAKWAAPGGTPYSPSSATHYFLSKIVDKAGTDAAVLSYATPSGCPGGGAASTPGTPYIERVTLPETALRFTYKLLHSTGGGVECVLDQLHIESPGGAVVPIVAYAYTWDGQERPGRLAFVSNASGSESYSYPATGGFSAQAANATTTAHTHSTGGIVTSDVGGGQSLTVAPPTASNCQPGAQCCTAPTAVSTSDSFAGAGDGTAATLTTVYEMSSNINQFFEPRRYRYSDSCVPATACSPGTTQHEWTCSTPSTPGHEVGSKNKRDHWIRYDVEPPLQGLPQNLLERKAVKLGATDMTGAGALEVTNYSYAYTPETQVVQLIDRASVADPGGTGIARTALAYQVARVRSVIRTGWTQVHNGSWQVQPRIIGTFYFTTQTCTGDFTPDPLNRIREVHGPCALSLPTDHDCPAGTSYPVTQYTYWPASINNTSNHLRRVSLYPNGGPSCSSPIEYTMDSYDVFGNPTSITDPNGVVTALTYDNDHHVLSRTIAGHTTSFTYLGGGLLSQIQFPEGNTEVFDWQDGLLRARAKGTLHAYSERAEFDYWPDRTLKEERYLSSTGAVRRRVQHAADAHRRPTRTALGSAAVVGTRAFDRNDNLAGVGLPFNNPPPWCGGMTSGTPHDLPTSRLCSWLGYDRADRLESLVEHADPANATSDATTCLGYDKQGNINKIIAGCQTSDSCSVILSSPLHACQVFAATYQWDDFGNLINVTLPQTGPSSGSPGITKYAYDPRGNVTRKQTPQMLVDGDAVERTYDLLGRPLVTNHRLPNGGMQQLYRFSYDSSESPDPTCDLPTNTGGRLLRRVDSFGSTWYHYDQAGRVTREMRIRDPWISCSSYLPWSNPHTFYAYTPNGNTDYAIYPYGRKITYVHGTGAWIDRVDHVMYSLVNEYWSNPLLLNVTWEPYSHALRSYDAVTTMGIRRVVYWPGAASQASGAGCSTTPPPSNDETGRLRALWVSTSSGSGDIYNRTYTWNADQVERVETCVLGGSVPRTESFTYDALTRLTLASRPPGNFTAQGGTFESRGYTYDGRGRRVAATEDACAFSFTFGSDRRDRLQSMSAGCNPREFALQYDVDGRVTGLSGAATSSPYVTGRWSLGFDYGGATGGSEGVFKAVNGGAAYTNYFYDALGRRRLKQDAMGSEQEFFYDLRHQMLVDAFKPGMGSHGQTIIDEYVWLGERPVAIIRNRMGGDFNRQGDQSGNCMMNWSEGEAACGVYFPVTDHLRKPVLILDANGRIAGAADYDPFGRANRVTFNRPQAATYANNLIDALLWEMTQPPEPGMAIRMRVRFHLNESTWGSDYAVVKDVDTGMNLASSADWPSRTPWLTTQGGRLGLYMNSDAANCCPTSSGHPDCGCPEAPNFPFKGVVPEEYEFRRYQVGATPFWTPLRFPGQYYDDDTGLSENWNRFYFDVGGAYLQPEPILRSPYAQVVYAHMGHSLPVYSYAGNNPIAFVDKNGLFFTSSSNEVWGVLQHLAADPYLGPAIERMAADPHWNFDVSLVPYDRSEVGGWTYNPFESGPNQETIASECNVQKANAVKRFHWPGSSLTPWNLRSLIAHELGHAYSYAYEGTSGVFSHPTAVDFENSQRGLGPFRPNHDDLGGGQCRRACGP